MTSSILDYQQVTSVHEWGQAELTQIHRKIAGVDRDRFLRLVTITHGGVDCTVGDIIDVVAHAFGGVHHGQLWSDGDRALAVLEQEVLIYDESMHELGSGLAFCLTDKV